MLIKKLAVPLINEKLLIQAEHCQIATAAISAAAFNFVRSRLPPKCKIDIVTSFDQPTDPEVLRQIMKHYRERISLKIFTRNSFHANMFMLDLPYRKSVAFVGSGACTMPGLKDAEEIFWKVSDPKEIESIKSWFIGYFEFAEPISENFIQQYELIYPNIRQREIKSQREKEDVMAITTRGFNWETIKFKQQFFKKEDFSVLGFETSRSHSPVADQERTRLGDKLTELNSLIARDAALLHLRPINLEFESLTERQIVFGRSENDLKKYQAAAIGDFMTMQVILTAHQVRIALVPGYAGYGRIDRENLKLLLADEPFRVSLREKLLALGNEFIVEVFGQKLTVMHFVSDESLLEFFKYDDWRYYDFWIGRNFHPGDPALNTQSIALTINDAFKNLLPLYELIRHKP